MKIISWNIRHGGGKRIKAIADRLLAHGPDVIVLPEFRQDQRGKELRFLLNRVGFTFQAAPEADRCQNSVLLASKQPYERCTFPVALNGDTHRVVGIRFESFDLFGVYFANGEKKIPLWNTLIEAAPVLLQRPTLLVGDFNTGLHRIDEKGATFWCAEHFEQFQGKGMIDVWRHLYGPDAREWTWLSPKFGNGFRLDHAFCSPALLPRIRNVWYSHAEREERVSDHSMVIVELDRTDSTATLE